MLLSSGYQNWRADIEEIDQPFPFVLFIKVYVFYVAV